MKKILCILSVAFLLTVLSVRSDAAGVQDREVEVIGSGITREKAVNDGLAQAVGQVTGLQFSAEDIAALHMDMRSRESNDEGGVSSEVEMNLGEQSMRQTHAKIRGTVKSYTILGEEPSTVTQGYVDVRMRVVVSYYEADPQTQRKRIAVLPFRVLEGTKAEDLFVLQLNQALTNYLTQTRNFAVLDRDYLAEKHREFNMLQGDDIRIEERARVGSTLGTDYIVVGSLTAFSAGVFQEKVPYTNEPRQVVKGRVALAWRVIDAPTGQITASGSHDEKFSKTSRDLNDLDWLAALARPAGEEIARKIVDTIYPIMAVAYRPGAGDAPGMLTLARGGDALKQGQRFQLVQYGEVMMDPYTKEPLAREEIRVGEVEIVDVAPKFSHAKVLNCTVELNGLQERQFIVRPLPAAEAGAADKPSRNRPKTMQPKW